MTMIWLAGSYYWFWQTLRACRDYDTAGTVILNAGLALLVGPLLLAAVPVLYLAAELGWLGDH